MYNSDYKRCTGTFNKVNFFQNSIIDFSYISKYTFTYTINDLSSGDYIYETLSKNVNNVNIINAINNFSKPNPKIGNTNFINNYQIKKSKNIIKDLKEYLIKKGIEIRT